MEATKALPCPKIVRGQQELTPEQEVYMRTFTQERLASLLSTAAIDEKEAEEHLKQSYILAGFAAPLRIRWFDSSMAFILAHLGGDNLWANLRANLGANLGANLWDNLWANLGDNLGDNLRANLGDNLGDNLRDNLWANLGDNLRDNLWDNLWDNLRDNLGANLRANLWDNLWANLGANLGANLRDNLRANLRANLWDNLWANLGDNLWANLRDNLWDAIYLSIQSYYDENWLAFYRFFHEVYEENKLIHLALFNEMVSGYRLGSKEAWLVRKPIVLSRDEQGRLHSGSSMCMQYKDGWGFYAWHGVRCAEKIILYPETLTKEDWMNESNLELRRVIQERLGNDRFVEVVGGKVIDKGKRGSLVEVDLGNDPERVARYVHVKDTSTERMYYLRVPPHIKRADLGVAWTFGMDEKDYQPVQEA